MWSFLIPSLVSYDFCVLYMAREGPVQSVFVYIVYILDFTLCLVKLDNLLFPILYQYLIMLGLIVMLLLRCNEYWVYKALKWRFRVQSIDQEILRT